MKIGLTFSHSRRASGELGEVRKTSTSTRVRTEVSVGIEAAAAGVVDVDMARADEGLQKAR